MIEKKELKNIKGQAKYCLHKMLRLDERIDSIEIEGYVSTLGYHVSFTNCDKAKGTTKTQLMEEIKSLRMELMILSKSLERIL